MVNPEGHVHPGGLSKLLFFFFFSVLFTGLALSMASMASADAFQVKAAGSAPLSAGKGEARDMAHDDALRSALKSALGTYLTDTEITDNYSLLTERFFLKPDAFIKRSSVVSEGEEGKLYNVTVSAVIDRYAVKEALSRAGLMERRANTPRILFMIAEQSIEKRHFIQWWSFWGERAADYKAEVTDVSATDTKLKELFAEGGFIVVDPMDVTEEIEIDEAYRLEDLTIGGAKFFGDALGADIVIKGKAITREGIKIPESQLGLYMADVTAAAVSVRDGRVLASGRGHGVSRHISPITGSIDALEEASEELAIELMEQIEARWTERSSIVTLNIEGLKSYDELMGFRDMISGRVKGVSGVYERHFKGGEAKIDVETSRDADDIAAQITKSSGDISVTILNISNNSIDIHIGSASRP